MPRFPKSEPEIMALAERQRTRITPTADKYRIIAINKSGDGPPSNTVMVVL